MPESANVRSIDAVRRFHAAVLQFQEDARLAVSSLELQLQRIMGWLERDRPGFWKREIELCYRELGEARVRLHRCELRKTGDFRPTCYEEKKALEKAKRDLEFAQKQVPVVKFWNVNAQHEANEYHGRSSQLTQILERDIPMLLALLHQALDRLEAYGNVRLPDAKPVSFSSPGGSDSDAGNTETQNTATDGPSESEQPESEVSS